MWTAHFCNHNRWSNDINRKIQIPISPTQATNLMSCVSLRDDSRRQIMAFLWKWSTSKTLFWCWNGKFTNTNFFYIFARKVYLNMHLVRSMIITTYISMQAHLSFTKPDYTSISCNKRLNVKIKRFWCWSKHATVVT